MRVLETEKKSENFENVFLKIQLLPQNRKTLLPSSGRNDHRLLFAAAAAVYFRDEVVWVGSELHVKRVKGERFSV